MYVAKVVVKHIVSKASENFPWPYHFNIACYGPGTCVCVGGWGGISTCVCVGGGVG